MPPPSPTPRRARRPDRRRSDMQRGPAASPGSSMGLLIDRRGRVDAAGRSTGRTVARPDQDESLPAAMAEIAALPRTTVRLGAEAGRLDLHGLAVRAPWLGGLEDRGLAHRARMESAAPP